MVCRWCFEGGRRDFREDMVWPGSEVVKAKVIDAGRIYHCDGLLHPLAPVRYRN